MSDTGTTYLRQLGLFETEHKTMEDFVRLPILIIGCGGIGSFLAAALGKMGCQNLTLCDPDKVEEHNRPNQNFGIKDIDKEKVVAMQDYLKEREDINATVHIRTFPDLVISPKAITISAVDSLETRKKIWQEVKNNPTVELFIDGRMAGTLCEVYAIERRFPKHRKYYESTLQGKPAEEECTARSIIYCADGITALIGSILRNNHIGKDNPTIVTMNWENFMISKKEVPKK